MSKKNQKNNIILSSALRNNLKLRKKQISLRDKKNILGKRTDKIGFSNLLNKKIDE